MSELPKKYLRWLADEMDLYGDLQVAVYNRLGLPLPPPPKSLDERIDEVVREVHEDFEAGRIPSIVVLGGE